MLNEIEEINTLIKLIKNHVMLHYFLRYKNNYIHNIFTYYFRPLML